MRAQAEHARWEERGVCWPAAVISQIWDPRPEQETARQGPEGDLPSKKPGSKAPRRHIRPITRTQRGAEVGDGNEVDKQ